MQNSMRVSAKIKKEQYKLYKEMERVKTRWILAWGSIALLSMFGLTGCSKIQNSQNDMKNVEERDYATILLLSDGEEEKRYHFSLGIAQEKMVGERSQIEELSSWDCDNFEELAQEYQLVKGKDLSLAHLKVILFSMEQMDILEELQELLYLMDENSEIAKTCPVLQLTEKERFLIYLKKAEEPVGNYLAEMIETSERQGRDVPWLKDYLKKVREGTETDIYYLESVSEGWRVSAIHNTEKK